MAECGCSCCSGGGFSGGGGGESTPYSYSNNVPEKEELNWFVCLAGGFLGLVGLLILLFVQQRRKVSWDAYVLGLAGVNVLGGLILLL
ncbi:MAG: hypothetical protein A2940_00575 [Candidatus Wildermuthbacteria bacterium RIFCSPLOWO2_01_FULL_48_29]|uniref:Uncharacterized protein n=1 Tax=Candidatus Wildermuthbacteria bacterium RIFCSPLOWO2_01_FULL_48_29 TaxID=1802462 RepID=A0A1G2RJU9_9BACT|nr:MAG: hypothetical protein A2940_00575 [Candidatus Wildermuthbacteria bacterium RIFCSPLOWO2_01_FULL_48_29]